MSGKQKYALDTSILIENISQDGNKVIEMLERNKITRRYHLNHCLIEFRLGLLHNWIGFYLDVLATQDIKGAKRRLAKQINFRPRQGSNHVLLDALLYELFDRIESGSVDLYLLQVEGCIDYVQVSLKLLSDKIIGSNADHHVLKPDIITSQDYEDFHKRCKDDYVVDLETIFSVRAARFRELLDYLDSLSLNSEEAKRVNRIKALVQQGLADVKKANSKSQNRRYGDIIIAMDTPAGYHVLSTDDSFRFLCDGLEKIFVDFKKFSQTA